MIFAGCPPLGASGGSPVRAIQADLKHMGLPVTVSGLLDRNTVDAINGVFGGWDDAPAHLRTGRLTAKDVAKNLPDVRRYVRLAAHGAMNVEAGSY